MNNKKTKETANTKHLEKALFENRVASVNDCTGFMNTPPETNEKAENMSDLLNVTTSPRSKKKK